MQNADFRIYVGVDNKIEFVLRKTDRRPVPIVGRKVRLVLKNRYTDEILAQPYLTPVDYDKSIMLLTLSKETTASWPVGALAYGAVVEEPDGSQMMLFTDENECGVSYCYVSQATMVPREVEGDGTLDFSDPINSALLGVI